jgi:hypothetical protein
MLNEIQGLTISGFKSRPTRTGERFSCTVWLDGKKMGTYCDPGTGGEPLWYWVNPGFDADLLAVFNGNRYAREQYICILCDAWDTASKIKPRLSTTILYRLKEHPSDTFRTKPSTPDTMASDIEDIRRCYGDRLDVVLNTVTDINRYFVLNGLKATDAEIKPESEYR